MLSVFLHLMGHFRLLMGRVAPIVVLMDVPEPVSITKISFPNVAASVVL